MKTHILLIDDDKDELGIFLDALKKVTVDDGFKCTYASNPVQALDMLKYLVPDYIFLDLNMPQMNGLEFLNAINDDQKLTRVKIFLYSTKISGNDAEKAHELGVSGCIEKTQTIDILSDRLGSVFVPFAASLEN